MTTSAPDIAQDFAQRVKNITVDEARDYIDYMIRHEIPANGDPGIDIILARAHVDTMFFGQVFTDWLYDEMTWQHKGHWDLIDDDECPWTVMNAWRGFGKSAAAKIKVLKCICFRELKYVMWVGSSYKNACDETESIKTELISNERIRHIFGSLKAGSYNDVDSRFSQESWVAADPTTNKPICLVVPKGAGQTIRGRNTVIAGQLVRPQLIIGDDLEDDEEILNEENRVKLRKWFNGALLKCVNTRKQPNPKTHRWERDKNDPNWTYPWRIFYQDTLKHEDSLMARVLQSPRWKSVVYPLCRYDEQTKQYYSLVPELVSHAQVRSEVDAAIQDQLMDVFCREMMCLPSSPEHAAWTRDSFQYYDDDNKFLNTAPGVENFIVVDPAKTANARSAYTAMLAFAMDPREHRIYFRKLVNARLESARIWEVAFDLAAEMNATVMAVEITGQEGPVKHMVETERRLRNANRIKPAWLTAHRVPKGDFGTGREAAKRARVSTVLPYYQRGYIYHEKSLRDSMLENQLLSFPSPKFWDAADCAGYVPEILEAGGRFFQSRLTDDSDGNEDNGNEPRKRRSLRARIHSREWALI
jgi:hypothetical protein